MLPAVDSEMFIVIVLKRNESRPECRPGSGLHRLIHPSYMISYEI
jgi:hypothetical protein